MVYVSPCFIACAITQRHFTSFAMIYEFLWHQNAPLDCDVKIALFP